MRPGGIFALVLSLIVGGQAQAQRDGSYTTPTPFMELFFDLSGNEERDYPRGRPTIGQMLSEAEFGLLRGSAAPGPLILVVGSDIHVYDSGSGTRLAHERFRADRDSGFFEMTAISHIGPAMAYLAQIKADGDSRWKERLASLVSHVREVRALNSRAADNWLDRLDPPSWRTHKDQIRAMVDYACARTIDYASSLGDGTRLTVTNVNDDFFNGKSAAYPIPFRNVMIATFMLDTVRTVTEVQSALARVKLDWANALVLVSSRAGSNVSSGLTDGTNWLVSFLQAASGFTLPGQRIKIAPYMEIRPGLGDAQLAADDLNYYTRQVWGPLYYRELIADRVFSNIPTAYLPGRPALPGDPGVTSADAIDQFMIRLKHSLRDSREMLSNTVAFWMVSELGRKNWDPAAADIPGLTTGLPADLRGYPAVALK